MFSTLSYSQEIRNDSLYKNAIYFEAGGNGLFYSAGYDRIISYKQKQKITVGTGFSVYPDYFDFVYENMLIIPVNINMLFGEKNKFFETGIGMDLAFADREGERFNLAACVRLGYRSINKNNFFFRAALTPFFWIEKEYENYYEEHKVFHALPWAGVCFGKVF
jgi:hypothetical protein